ncbi:MAG: ferrochelatase [Alphaproteobacteria bacterium]|nr:ferrochelatase [Alphaproteobacteria bacterium]
MARTAIVVFNLGGPDGPDAVRPFLFNLFSDPLIIRAPGPLRWALAQFISRRRAPVARAIYAEMGGASPILQRTRAQAEALQAEIGEVETRVFVAMRYWHPFAAECAAEVKAFAPDRVVLLPLYPQFSTSTTASFARVWTGAARDAGLAADTRIVCCYPAEPGFVAATAALIRESLARIEGDRTPRLLFSAHGLPENFIAAGDPYCSHVGMTVAAVVQALDGAKFEPSISYQSRVGSLEWVKPYTDDEIRRAGAEGVPLVIVPIAFVSEHSETLVELDIEYGRLARESGVPQYERVPAVGTHPDFIGGLARLAKEALSEDVPVMPDGGARLCGTSFGACPCRAD